MKKQNKYLLKSTATILLIFCIIMLPVSGVNLTYPKEYYQLGEKSVDEYNKNFNSMTDSHILIAQYLELRRQSILIERQNELIAEQNDLLKNRLKMRLVCSRYLNMAGSCVEWELVT